MNHTKNQVTVVREQAVLKTFVETMKMLLQRLRSQQKHAAKSQVQTMALPAVTRNTLVVTLEVAAMTSSFPPELSQTAAAFPLGWCTTL